MGAWGHRAFENDTTCDWAYGLEELDDLSHVEAAFDELEEVGEDYLDSDLACDALGACEVLARLLGHPGYSDAHTEAVDTWVAAHKIVPGAALLKRADAAITRILGEESELRELWADSEGLADWQAAMKDLQQRLIP